MAYSYTKVTAAAGQTSVPFNFDYLSTDEIKVSINDVETTAWSLSSPNIVALDSALAGGEIVEVERVTNLTTRAVDFSSGAVLTEEDLDLSAQQVFNAVQEAIDSTEKNLAETYNGQYDAQNKRIVNLADPVDAQDAVTKAHLDYEYPAVLNVSNNMDDVNTVATNMSDINEVQDNITDINTVVTNMSDINTVATNIDDVITVANDLNEAISEVETVANDLNEAISEIEVVANNIDNVNTVGTNISKVDTLATGMSEIQRVYTSVDEIDRLWSSADNIDTLAPSADNIDALAPVAADITTVADNISDVTNFADVYLGGKASDPTTRNDGSALQTGDLYFNSSVNELRTYSGTQWVSGTAGTMGVQRFTGDGVTASFTLSTAPSGENNTQVYVNGIYQQKDTYSVSGTSLILSEAPEADQVVEVVTISTLALGQSAASLTVYTDITSQQTNVQSKLQEVETTLVGQTNVKEFGAVGDGVTNDNQAFIDAENSGKTIVVPAGTYDADNHSTFSTNAFFDSNALFKDVTTGEFFNVEPSKKAANIKNAFENKTRMHKTGWAPAIVCYGDSNTRYYEGDTGTAGPYSKSYGAWIDRLCGLDSALYSASIEIKGYPGQTAQYGEANFATNVPSSTDVVVIGFGTNNVKLHDPDVESYLASMEAMVTTALAQRTVPIVLGIPWYSSNYGTDGQLSQDRITVWNARLYRMCLDVGAYFIDTYSITKGYPSVYFNEATTMRHYSPAATHAIGSRVVEILNEIMVGSAKYKSTGLPAKTVTSFENLHWIKNQTGSISNNKYDNGGIGFDTLVIPSGASITFRGIGRGCVSFYPRASATAVITSTHENTNKTITPDIDNGFYYLVDRHFFGTGYMEGSNEITITASGGSLYISALSFEQGFEVDTATYDAGIQEIHPAALPARGVRGRKYFLTSIAREAYYYNGIWFGPEGLYVVGTTSQMNAVSSAPCAAGYKFWNTDTSSAYRWNGTAWVAA